MWRTPPLPPGGGEGEGARGGASLPSAYRYTAVFQLVTAPDSREGGERRVREVSSLLLGSEPQAASLVASDRSGRPEQLYCSQLLVCSAAAGWGSSPAGPAAAAAASCGRTGWSAAAARLQPAKYGPPRPAPEPGDLAAEGGVWAGGGGGDTPLSAKHRLGCLAALTRSDGIKTELKWRDKDKCPSLRVFN